MKKIFLLLFLFAAVIVAKAQKITGFWLSSDSTRVYEIKQNGDNTFTAVIKSSVRKNDKAGFVVIKDMVYNSHKKRYEGLMYAVSGGEPVFVKIKFDKKHSNIIVLKLDRMFFLDVSLNWVKA